MNSAFRQGIIFVIQISIGVALVIWIMMQLDRHQFINYYRNLSVEILLIIAILSVASLFVQYRRWKYLVQRYSAHYDLKDILPSFFSGFAFRLIIPGGHAEFSKIFLLPGQKRGKVLAFGMEKIFQTMIKLAAILIVLPFTFPEYSLLCITILVVLSAGYFVFPRSKVIKGMQEKDVLYHQVFLMNVLFSLGIFLIMGIQYYVLLNQVSSILFTSTLHTAVYLWGAGMVPISISGLGIREGLAVYFFNFYGVSAAHAVATSLFLFALNTIIPALIGVYYIYRNRGHFGEIKDSFKSTREVIAAIRNNRKSDEE
jgi:uncharacterized membrane protein YbhN (UPF0104 family)